MSRYYSPTGNIELWNTKPDGYYTEEGWEAAHPELFPPSDLYAWSGSEWVLNTDRAQDSYKESMKAQKDYFVNSGAMVTVTVDLVDYTGCFHPTDSGLDSGAGASAYRESVDSTVPPVPFGGVWSCKDESGCYIEIPMTEALLAKIGSYVKSWHVACNNAYITRRTLMFEMTAEQLQLFNPEQDMIDNLPSRSIVIP